VSSNPPQGSPVPLPPPGSEARRILIVSPAGSMYDNSWPPHKLSEWDTNTWQRIDSGSVYAYDAITPIGGLRNMISNGSLVASLGGSPVNLLPQPGAAATVAVRLGVGTSDTSGNIHPIVNEYGFIHPNTRPDLANRYTFMANGEAVFQDTASGAYGASSETFYFGVASLTVDVPAVAVGGLGTFVTVNKSAGTNNFLTATLVNAGGPPGTNYGYVPSRNFICAGDVIQITQAAVIYSHRVASVVSGTAITITPPWGRKADGTANGATGPAAALSATVLRTGYNSFSRIVPIFNSTNATWYNYYAGNFLSMNPVLPMNGGLGPSVIQCFTRESSGAVSSNHFMSPQDSAGNDVRATDIASYKGFLLYGYGSSIGWSLTGFPISFTTGFDATIFPASNKSAIAIDDWFICFEWLGEQLIAIFEKSIWLIQASGSIPEFSFFKLPEPVGCYLANAGQSTQINVTNTSTHWRPSCSGRAAVYYTSRTSLLKLAGTTATKVSDKVNYLYATMTTSQVWTPSWEASNDIVYLNGPGNTDGLSYRPTLDTWALFGDDSQAVMTHRGLTGTTLNPGTYQLGSYNAALNKERMEVWDSRSGAPWSGYSPSSTAWKWATPVINMGDEYHQFQFAGFQFDGVPTNSVTFAVYGGPYPAAMVQRLSGTISATDLGNRRLYGGKLDDAFIGIVISGTSWAQIYSLNIYAIGRGK
jgi:hypothetical protein